MLNLNDSEFARSMSINRNFDRIVLSIISSVALGAVLGAIFSIGTIDSFAQTDLTTTTTNGSTQDQGRNTTALTESFGDPFFVEQGRIIGQRVLAVAPQQIGRAHV
jgi:hypothetical protein